jgi:hypothetical protein
MRFILATGYGLNTLPLGNETGRKNFTKEKELRRFL